MRHSTLRGADLHSPSNELVENNTGSTIAALTAVTFNSLGTQYPSILPANGSANIIRGITQQAMLTGTSGFITSLGFLANVNTSAWPAGTQLYAGASGVLTTATTGLPIATVIKTDATYGQMYVNALGVSSGDIAGATFPPEAELEWMFSLPHTRPYQTFAYNAHNDMVDMDVYADNTEAIHIFNRHFTYDVNGRLATVTTTNLLSALTKTKTYNYDTNGNMVSVQET